MYSYERTAASNFDPAVVKRIERMTDQNMVAEALETGARMLDLKDLAKKVNLVGQIQKLEGHLPSGLKEYREGLYDLLMDEAKKILSADEYQKFYGSY